MRASRVAMWFSWRIATRTCLRFRDGVAGTGLHRLPQADCAGRLLRQAGRCAALVPQARGRSWGPLGSAAAQRGKASSCSPTRRTLPTGSARRRGSRLGNRRQGAARRRRGRRAPARRLRGGGVSPRPTPQARASGSSLATHRPKSNRVQRAGWRHLPARGVPRWKRGTEGVGAPVFMSAWPGVHPGQAPARRPAGKKGAVCSSRSAAVRSRCSPPVALGDEQAAALYRA